MMPYPQGTMRSEVWDYRGAVQSPNFPQVILERSSDSPIETDEDRIVAVSDVQMPASIFEVPRDFVQRNGTGDGAGLGLPVKAIVEAQLSDQLAAAEAKWAASKPQAYEFAIQYRFCCVFRVTTPVPEWPVFHVENGTASVVSGDRQLVGIRDIYGTVEMQFAFIRSKLAKRPYRVQIEYDPVWGYPRHVYIKMIENASEDEYGFEIAGFRVVARQ